jgi:aminoglycoside phosphotransferase family enzyme
MPKTRIDSNGKIYTIDLSKEKIQEDINEIDNLIDKAISDLPYDKIIAMIDQGLLTKEELCEMFRGNLEWQIAIRR